MTVDENRIDRFCPPWLGYLFLLNPLRKWVENPIQILGPFVQEGMMVLEPGCGMGFFTLPLARMVGPQGRVVALEIQPKMLAVLKRRARKAGLSDRIEARRIGAHSLGVEDLAGSIDFIAALYMVHEVPDQYTFLSDTWKALKPGGKLFIIEPKGHVSLEAFEHTIAIAKSIGFEVQTLHKKIGGRVTLLYKPIS